VDAGPATVAGRRIVDLTQPLSPRTPRSSDHPEVTFETVRWYSRHGLHTSVAHLSVHVGTHIDAPRLFLPNGATIDEIGLDVLCGPAVVIGFELDDWEVIDADRLAAAVPDIHPGDIVIIRTGWHRQYTDEQRYVLKSPGLDRSAFDWLIERGVCMVGSDTPSPEHIFMRSRQWSELRPDIFGAASFDPADFPPAYGHRSLFAHGIPLLEGLGGGIDELVGSRVELLALPLPYVGVEAAQARVVALV